MVLFFFETLLGEARTCPDAHGCELRDNPPGMQILGRTSKSLAQQEKAIVLDRLAG